MEAPDPEVVVQHAQAIGDALRLEVLRVVGAVTSVLRDGHGRLDGDAEAPQPLVDQR